MEELHFLVEDPLLQIICKTMKAEVPKQEPYVMHFNYVTSHSTSNKEL